MFDTAGFRLGLLLTVANCFNVRLVCGCVQQLLLARFRCRSFRPLIGVAAYSLPAPVLLDVLQLRLQRIAPVTAANEPAVLRDTIPLRYC